MPLRAPDFESGAYANFATPAMDSKETGFTLVGPPRQAAMELLAVKRRTHTKGLTVKIRGGISRASHESDGNPIGDAGTSMLVAAPKDGRTHQREPTVHHRPRNTGSSRHMESKATARFARIAPRKARTVINLVRGRKVSEAIDLLLFTRKAAAPVVRKVIESAIANARQADPGVDVDALYVTTGTVDKGPNRNLRRWRPRAMGRATQITKGVSHIAIVLTDTVPPPPPSRRANRGGKKATETVVETSAPVESSVVETSPTTP